MVDQRVEKMALLMVLKMVSQKGHLLVVEMDPMSALWMDPMMTVTMALMMVY